MEKKNSSFWSWYRAAFQAAPFYVSVVSMAILFFALIGVLELLQRVLA